MAGHEGRPLIRRGEPIRAVLVDLDDTLYPHAVFLDGAWSAVVAAAEAAGLPAGAFRVALSRVAAGTDSREVALIVRRAVAEVQGDPTLAPGFVGAFHAHRPGSLEPHRGVANALDRLTREVRLGLIADGDPAQQRAKLEATGLAELFDVVVCTADHGATLRKPHPHGFRVALASLGTTSATCVMVGDHPQHDVLGSHAVGMVAIRVRQGEHAHLPTVGAPTAWTTPDALDEIAARVGALR